MIPVPRYEPESEGVKSGVLHADILAAGIGWAQPDWQKRPLTPGQQVWAFAPSQGVPTIQRRWYRATIICDHIDYPRVRFDEGRPGAPSAFRAGLECILYRANIRTDLDALESAPVHREEGEG